MDDALARSRRVVTLLSHAYLASPFCGREWQAVFARDPRNFDQRLVLLRVSECQPTGILCTLAYTDLVPLLGALDALRDVVLARLAPGRTPTTADVAAAYQRDARPVLHPDVGPVPNFTGREGELLAVGDALASGAPAGVAQTVVYGLGGVGKSALAHEFGWRRRDGHAGVWIVNAVSPESIKTSLIELGRHFIPGLDSVQDRAEAARATLERILPGFRRPWLLIYDNLDSEALLRRWTPRENARVLVTSRVQTFSEALRKVPLDLWQRAESVRYLREESGRADVQELEFEAVADDLGDLPLALAHAGAYLREHSAVTAGRYRARIAAHLAAVPPGFEGQPSVFATFRTAIEAVDARKAGASTLMRVAGWLAPDAIPREVFTQSPALYSEALAILAADEDRLDETLSALDRASLIRYSPATLSFAMHRLVQAAARSVDDRDGLRSAVRVLEAAFPKVEIPSWTRCARLISHALRVNAAVDDDEALTFGDELARLCNHAGFYVRARGHFRAAEPLFRRALRIAEATHGPDHPLLADRLGNLAVVLHDTKRLAEAEQLARRALIIDEVNHLKDHPELVVRISNLAELLRDTNQPTESEALHRRALAIAEQHYGPSDARLVTVLNNFAGLLQQTGRPTEAEPLFRRALSIAEVNYGPNDPRLAGPLHNLGLLMLSTDHLREAESLLRREVMLLIRLAHDAGHGHPKLDLALLTYIGVSAKSMDAPGNPMTRVLEAAAEAGIDEARFWAIVKEFQDWAA